MSEPALHGNEAVAAVLTVNELGLASLRTVLEPGGLEVILVAPGEPIPGTYWGEPEAGLIRNRLYVRSDTPVHSALHEAAHYHCMDAARRRVVDRDAGGDFDEENAVCYMQILLAGELPGVGRERMCADMDAWGYTFRLGSSARWFDSDAEDARQWLCRRGLIKVTPFDAGGDDAGTLD
jgi:hypothetical protein